MNDDAIISWLLDADEHAGGGTRYQDAADAITKLRAERDALKDELRRTCEHLGLDQLLAERDALRADLAAARAKIDSLRHHVKALQLLVKMQHAPQDMKLFAAEVDAIDAALAGKDAT